MRLIVVGAGRVARELLSRLGEAWDVTVVDHSADRLGNVRTEHEARTVLGDGSSRVVLERAGLAEADGLVAASDDDDVNLEVCRIGLAAKTRRLAAVAADPDRLPDYRELGVAAYAPARLTARQLEVQLEPKRIASKSFAGGRVEAMEFRVAPNSPMRGRKLDALGSSRVVATILRGDELIVPDGRADLTFEADDLVTVVGAAVELPDIVRIFTAASSRFPLDHGKRVAVALAGEEDLESCFLEALTAVRSTRATSVLVLHPEEPSASLIARAEERAGNVHLDLRATPNDPRRTILRLPEAESVGILVVRASGRGPVRRALSAGLALRTPVLFSRGKERYDRVLVAARQNASGVAAAQAAVDLAEMAGADLLAIAVKQPEFIGGPQVHESAGRAVDHVKELAAVHGMEARELIGEGNPVRAILHASERADLVVAGMPRRSLRRTLPTHLARRSPASVLVVPALR